MIFKLPSIEISNLEPLPKCDWLKNKFVPLGILFPNCHESLILDLLGSFKGIVLEPNKGDISITLPLFYHIDFPQPLKNEIALIISNLIQDYTPELKEYLGQKVTEDTVQSMVSKFRSYEKAIIGCGGYSLKEELSFRLGILPYFLT